jgi:hypothetical protein
MRVLWRRPQWYSAKKYVARLPRWVRELYCQTTYIIFINFHGFFTLPSSCSKIIEKRQIPEVLWKVTLGGTSVHKRTFVCAWWQRRRRTTSVSWPSFDQAKSRVDIPFPTTFRFKVVIRKESSRSETRGRKNEQTFKRKFSNCNEIEICVFKICLVRSNVKIYYVEEILKCMPNLRVKVAHKMSSRGWHYWNKWIPIPHKLTRVPVLTACRGDVRSR